MGTDGILGNPNRTENWLTARTFVPLITRRQQGKLAARIIKQAEGSPVSFEPDEVSLELYWKGFRDYCHLNGKEKPTPGEIAARYRRMFPALHEDVCAYNEQAGRGRAMLRDLQPANYICSAESARALYDNLLNTEVDVVLSAPGYLLVGEAKHEETFGVDSRLVLVHQLVRQYVMTSLLRDMIASKDREQVIPFVVCDSPPHTMRTAQVRFLHHQGWLSLKNVMSWDEMRRLAGE